MAETVSKSDLTQCDREPIHIPGRVQSYGVLLLLAETGLSVQYASTNCAQLLGTEAAQLIGNPIASVLGERAAKEIAQRLGEESVEGNPSYVSDMTPLNHGSMFHAIIHRNMGRIFLELEPLGLKNDLSLHNLYGMIRAATGRLKGAAKVPDLCQVTAEEVRRISGFDRVMVYRFDVDWNGVVVAEDKTPEWNSYFDLRFPASDIPRQARELYLLNRFRLISQVHATPAELVPASTADGPIDMSYCVLRSVSPVHIEYLQNMGVEASMSISVVKDGRLWGLIACHHRTERRLPYEARAALEHLGEIVALQLTAKEYAEGAEYRIALKAVISNLLAQMAAYENYVDGLIHDPNELLSLADATGCAVSVDGGLHVIGQTPSRNDVEKLIEWLRANQVDRDVFYTENLPSIYPDAEAYKDQVSGVLAVSIPRFRRSYIAWFRPEIMRTVKWAGDPNKPVERQSGHEQRLHPRKSFETWQETVRGKSQPWRNEEVVAVSELRDAIITIILRKAEELASVNLELQRSNKELEAFSYSVSHDLRAPFRHIFGFTDLLRKRATSMLDETSLRYINTIMDSAQFAGALVDSLLAFSQMSRTAIKPRAIEMSALVREVKDDLVSEIGDRQIEWHIGPLPAISGDMVMLKLAVRNLLSNAVKYTRKQVHPVIDIGSRDEGAELIFYVRDNGVGFDMRFKEKLFGVFQRLHRPEEFEGTGIGLANVRRTIERHGGRTWAEGQPNLGATFYFSLPKQASELQ